MYHMGMTNSCFRFSPGFGHILGCHLHSERHLRCPDVSAFTMQRNRHSSCRPQFRICTELYRKGALTSRIWFELLWVAAFFLAYSGECCQPALWQMLKRSLGGAIAATMVIPNAVCQTGKCIPHNRYEHELMDTLAGSMKLACMTSMVLIAFNWITSSLCECILTRPYNWLTTYKTSFTSSPSSHTASFTQSPISTFGTLQSWIIHGLPILHQILTARPNLLTLGEP